MLGNARLPGRARRRRRSARRAGRRAAARTVRRRSSPASTARSAGILAIADPVKASTPEALAGLKAEGIRVVMLTGDNWTTAKAVARRLGIDEVEAEVLPEQKSAVVDKLQARQGRVVAMAGDGVNDAPALAAADVGIAMGTGHRRGDGERRRHPAEGRPDRASCGRGGCRRPRCATSARTCSSPSSTTPLGVPVAAGVLYPVLRHPALADHRGGGHGPVVGQRHRQRHPAADRALVTERSLSPSASDHPVVDRHEQDGGDPCGHGAAHDPLHERCAAKLSGCVAKRLTHPWASPRSATRTRAGNRSRIGPPGRLSAPIRWPRGSSMSHVPGTGMALSR